VTNIPADCSELRDEAEIFRQELGSLITDLRLLCKQIKSGEYMGTDEGVSVADAIEGIINASR
jgi:hypothetical protein